MRGGSLLILNSQSLTSFWLISRHHKGLKRDYKRKEIRSSFWVNPNANPLRPCGLHHVMSNIKIYSKKCWRLYLKAYTSTHSCIIMWLHVSLITVIQSLIWNIHRKFFWSFLSIAMNCGLYFWVRQVSGRPPRRKNPLVDKMDEILAWKPQYLHPGNSLDTEIQPLIWWRRKDMLAVEESYHEANSNGALSLSKGCSTLKLLRQSLALHRDHWLVFVLVLVLDPGAR